jgi:hypothetical protein
MDTMFLGVDAAVIGKGAGNVGKDAAKIDVEWGKAVTAEMIDAELAKQIRELWRDWAQRPEVTWQHDWASAQRLLHTQNFFRQQYGFTDFTINQCGMEQHSLMARNLPDLVKQHTRNQFLQEIESRSADRNLVGQLENCIAELAQPANAVDYHKYFDSIDQRRGTLWRQAFPELA